MEKEILDNAGGAEQEVLTEKELLWKRRQEQTELAKKSFTTEAEEKQRALVRLKEEEELEKQLAPFYSARKFCTFLCVFMWLFAGFCLLTGTMEMSIFIPMCLWVLGAAAAVNIPIFIKKKKIFDGIIAAVAAAVCITLGVLIFTMG